MRRIWKEPPKYEEAPLKNLSLEALLRIEKKLAEMEGELREYTTAKPVYDARLATYVAQLENELRQLDGKAKPLEDRLRLHCQKIIKTRNRTLSTDGLLRWVLGLPPSSSNYTTSDARSSGEIDEDRNIQSKLNEIARLQGPIRANISKPKIGPVPRPPMRNFRIRDQLKTFTVDADRIDRTLLMSLLEKKKRMLLQEQDKKKASQEVHQDIKAKAKAYDDKQREHAKSVRNKIKRQLHDYSDCPYCGTRLLISQAHADHIYPVAFGGLSTATNMVFVCQDCNQKKKTRTLREFIKEFGLDEHFVNRNLEQLRKKF